MARLITLLTDFGYRDNYVGVMKGVIAGICPEAQCIDLTHAVPPQAIASAQFALLTAYPYFPADAVHLVVVDPGVGTPRQAIAVQTSRGYFVAPDNGVLTGVLQHETAIAAVALTHAAYWRSQTPSATFHGRDIFAPVAAHLANGAPLTAVGTAIDPATLVRLPGVPPERIADGLKGQIQYIDTFGNAVTTIDAQRMAPEDAQVQVGTAVIPLGRTYADAEPGHAIALIGSHGWLEIAVREGSAQQQLSLTIGDEVVVQRSSQP